MAMGVLRKITFFIGSIALLWVVAVTIFVFVPIEYEDISRFEGETSCKVHHLKARSLTQNSDSRFRAAAHRSDLQFVSSAHLGESFSLNFTLKPSGDENFFSTAKTADGYGGVVALALTTKAANQLITGAEIQVCRSGSDACVTSSATTARAGSHICVLLHQKLLVNSLHGKSKFVSLDVSLISRAPDAYIELHSQTANDDRLRPKLIFDSYNCQAENALSHHFGKVPDENKDKDTILEGWNLVSSGVHHGRRSTCRGIVSFQQYDNNDVSECLKRCDEDRHCNTVNRESNGRCELKECTVCNIYDCSWTTGKRHHDSNVYTRLPNLISRPHQNARESKEVPESNGFATLVCNDASVYPATAMAQSLIDTGSLTPIHFIVADTVDQELVTWLESLGYVYLVPKPKRFKGSSQKGASLHRATDTDLSWSISWW